MAPAAIAGSQMEGGGSSSSSSGAKRSCSPAGTSADSRAAGADAAAGHGKHTPSKNEEAIIDLITARIQVFKEITAKQEAVPSEDVARFVWAIGRHIFKKVGPGQDWFRCKGMLKELIDFDNFNAGVFGRECMPPMVNPEEKVPDVLGRYLTFLKTREVTTRHQRPQVLGETDLVMMISKPAGWLCSYGGDSDEPPEISNAVGPTSMLNLAPTAKLQIHEYIARQFNFETASRTREFWATKAEKLECVCQKCETCAGYISGCVNRLDIETSGVMVIAKQSSAFSQLRDDIGDKQQSGAEKHYLALVHGALKVQTPASEPDRPGWGVVEGYMKWDAQRRKSMLWTDADEEESQKAKDKKGRDDGGKTFAKTIYRPIVRFTSTHGSHDGKEQLWTLVHLQIFTGRRHQIRYHCALLGHPLVGDARYWDAEKCRGTPEQEHAWAGRIFLHSYQTSMREPSTRRMIEAVAPLPPELGSMMEDLLRKGSAEVLCGEVTVQTRALHQDLQRDSAVGKIFQKCSSSHLFVVHKGENELDPAPGAPQGPPAAATPNEYLPKWDTPAQPQASPVAAAAAERPPAAPAAAAGGRSELPEGWRVAASNSFIGKVYFVHDELGITQWDRPGEPQPSAGSGAAAAQGPAYQAVPNHSLLPMLAAAPPAPAPQSQSSQPHCPAAPWPRWQPQSPQLRPTPLSPLSPGVRDLRVPMTPRQGPYTPTAWPQAPPSVPFEAGASPPLPPPPGRSQAFEAPTWAAVPRSPPPPPPPPPPQQPQQPPQQPQQPLAEERVAAAPRRAAPKRLAPMGIADKGVQATEATEEEEEAVVLVRDARRLQATADAILARLGAACGIKPEGLAAEAPAAPAGRAEAPSPPPPAGSPALAPQTVEAEVQSAPPRAGAPAPAPQAARAEAPSPPPRAEAPAPAPQAARAEAPSPPPRAEAPAPVSQAATAEAPSPPPRPEAPAPAPQAATAEAPSPPPRAEAPAPAPQTARAEAHSTPPRAEAPALAPQATRAEVHSPTPAGAPAPAPQAGTRHGAAVPQQSAPPRPAAAAAAAPTSSTAEAAAAQPAAAPQPTAPPPPLPAVAAAGARERAAEQDSAAVAEAAAHVDPDSIAPQTPPRPDGLEWEEELEEAAPHPDADSVVPWTPPRPEGLESDGEEAAPRTPPSRWELLEVEEQERQVQEEMRANGAADIFVGLCALFRHHRRRHGAARPS